MHYIYRYHTNATGNYNNSCDVKSPPDIKTIMIITSIINYTTTSWLSYAVVEGKHIMSRGK